MYVEATKIEGGVQFLLIEQLDSVMKESSQFALNLFRSHLYDYGIRIDSGADLMQGIDTHIHFPASEVGKDGFSA
ncbi:unnamed protein product [Larinioides sclopetarius]|uniref:Lon proteolytic domain-containing protein n=1 Tax=Larinioides sclopetarius TaxID=280406 RepID=A0AAV2AA41_9ARAC